ncbi:MAG: hypothetical protein WBS20_04205 [Lysobacterales bacterium]
MHALIFDGGQSGGQENLPGILSWIADLPRHRLLLDVGSELVFFQGHFPDNPILPGITQLHWAVAAAMRLFEFSEVPCEVKRLKFMHIIRPSSILELLLERKKINEVEFQFSSSGQIHSTACLTFKVDIPC